MNKLSHFFTSPRFRTIILGLCFLFLGTICQAVDLRIWDYPRWLEPGETVDRFAWIKKQIARFQQENPDIHVTLSELTWARGDEKLKVAALGGHYPDLAAGSVPLLFIKENLIEPVDPYLEPGDREDYLPGALAALTVKEKLYGWPWYMGGQVLYLNRELFASATVPLPKDGHWTIDEFVSSMKQLKTWMSANRPNSYPLGLYYHKNETANFPFIFPFGGDWVDRNLRYRGSDPATLEGLNWVRGLIKEGLAPPDSGGRKNDDIWTGFAIERRLACGVFGLWAVKPLCDPKRNLMDFEIAFFPSPPGRESPAFLGTSGFYVFHRDDPERMRAAMKLARFLTRAEAQKDLVRHTQFPTRRSAGNLYAGNEPMTRAWEVLQRGRTVLVDERWPQIDEDIEGAVQNVLLDRIPPATAMEQCGKRVANILAREGGSIREDLQKGSAFGKIYLALFPFAVLLAIFSRQAHLLFILPALASLGLFLFYPLVDALVLAFRDYRIGEVGGYTLLNFSRAVQDPKFLMACWNTAKFTLIVVPANVLTALVVSSMIYALPGLLMRFFRAMYYLPGVASVVVLSMIWKWLFNRELGLFNVIVTWFGFHPIGWLSDPQVAFTSIILTGILRSPGGSMLIYLAAMANIPKSLYEAAEIEGASPFQKWWHITVPLLRSTTMFMVVTGTIDALQVFAQVLMLTDGGPADSTEVVVHRIFTSAFRDFDFGVSSAMALVLFLAILTMTLLQKRFGSAETEELA